MLQYVQKYVLRKRVPVRVPYYVIEYYEKDEDYL